MLTFGSLFAGIGGIDLGLERAGMQCRWQVEKNEYRRSVLARHWPSVRQHDDVRSWPAPDTERVDLIAGGFPCQPVSCAGKRLGALDDRWLWPDFARILRELRPRFALLENVPGLLRMGLDEVLGGLADLGFDAEWQVLSAAQFGAPHLRRRVWIVADAIGEGLEVRQSIGGDAREELKTTERDHPTPPNADGQRWKKGSDDVQARQSDAARRVAAHASEVQGIRKPIDLPERAAATVAGRSGAHGHASPNAHSNRRAGSRLHVFEGQSRRPVPDPSGSRWWPAEPPVRGRDDGFPRGLARRQIEALGDSVCVPVVEWIGRRIVEYAQS